VGYDERLAERIRSILAGAASFDEKKMFGGVAFLKDGKMFCGIVKDDLMVRVGAEQHELALALPHARPMDFTGRPMKGYVFVAPAGCRTYTTLGKWIYRGVAFVDTLSEGAHRQRRQQPSTAASKRRPLGSAPLPPRGATRK
jgi:TfoX/Sxy family transcriptional regulator of competence genes